ncbi:Modulator of drug activity B [Porphyridium purpureum]|uniref:Modulator of drug activity B n=1 Tax=Porphyridium purpureum TaxID=35688 RepID=A0A5J4ZA98_PORPP|nr:Modulator of drug activity B [Porphyridium purpureum]|eukprot:POR2000..scf295_1
MLVNGHEPYSFSPGRLNATLTDMGATLLRAKGHEVQVTYTSSKSEYDVVAEVEKHVWADVVILQIPVNWMAVPWSMKKYMDEVYSAGMDGRLCHGDGRTRADPSKQYGTGGTLSGKKYMLSVTFNAPEESFNDASQYLFQGKSVDELFFWLHMNFRFFDMEPLPTFAAWDVMKNPSVESDFERFKKHLADHFFTSFAPKREETELAVYRFDCCTLFPFGHATAHIYCLCVFQHLLRRTQAPVQIAKPLLNARNHSRSVMCKSSKADACDMDSNVVTRMWLVAYWGKCLSIGWQSIAPHEEQPWNPSSPRGSWLVMLVARLEIQQFFLS